MPDTPTLYLDIGSGTQDVFYHFPDRELENCPKFVLPSPAKLVAKRIAALPGRHIHLAGTNMGGGFFGAVKQHLALGGTISAHPEAALALSDDPARLEAMGMALSDAPPTEAAMMNLSDFDASWWKRLLDAAELPWPDRIAACAQDHGHHPDRSNRMGRFGIWEKLLTESGGRLDALIFDTPPPALTRLATLQTAIGGGLVADTGAAAVLGALFEPGIRDLQHERGITIINIGNSHVVAFLVHADRIFGIYEHHTGLRNGEQLWADISRFRTGGLTFEDVFQSHGHGCLTLDFPNRAQGFEPVFVLGPQREILREAPKSPVFPAPGGDMMLAGCFGMLLGLSLTGQAV